MVDHRFLHQGRADAQDHAADRLDARGLRVQDAAGGEHAEHPPQPDLAGVRVDADFGEMRAVGLLRKLLRAVARLDLAVGVDARRSGKLGQPHGLARRP